MRFVDSRPLLAGSLALVVVLAGGANTPYQAAYIRGTNIRSMMAIQELATALERYRHEHGAYPKAESMGDLMPLLHSQLAEDHGVDRWGEFLVVTVTPTSYVLTSKGDDRKGGHETGGPVETEGHSITMKDGVFVQYHASVEVTARKIEAQIARERAGKSGTGKLGVTTR